MNQQMLDKHTETPFYVQLKRILIEDVLMDSENEGRLPPLRDIAKKYGVSLVTVVKATEKLKTDGLISGGKGRGLFFKDKQKLLDSYARPRTRTVAVAFRDMFNATSPFLSEIIRDVAQECENRKQRLQIIPLPSHDRGVDFSFLREDEKMPLPDGLILSGTMPLASALTLKTMALPFVWMHNDVEDPDIYGVSVKKLASLNLVMAHFARLGYHKVTFLTSKSTKLQEYFSVLCDAHKLKGSFQGSVLPEENAGYLLTEEILNRDKPDALITYGSQMSAAALSALSEKKMSAPADIALVGIVSSLRDSFIPRNVTILLDPLEEMTVKAMAMLSDLMEGKTPVEKNPEFMMKLIVRGSCGFPVGQRGEITVSDINQIEKLGYPERRT